MLELYHNDMSTCAQKVRVVLAEKHLDWTGHHFKLREGPQHEPAYRKLNPNGVVPTLVDDGAPIIESTVICEYLDDRFPDRPLRPAEPADRARMRLWTKRLDEGLHAAIGTVSICIAFRHQYLAAGLDAQLEKVPDPVRRERRRTNIQEGVQSPYFQEALQAWHRLFSDMEDRLAHADWLAGETCSLADLAYAPYFARFEHLQNGHVFEGFGATSTYWDRLKARKGFREGIKAWENADYLAVMAREGNAVRPQVEDLVSSAGQSPASRDA